MNSPAFRCLGTLACRDLVAIASLLVLASAASAENRSLIELEGYSFDPLVSMPTLPAGLTFDTAPVSTGPFIVQFDREIESADRDVLDGFVTKIHGYLPHRAYLVTMPPAQVSSIRALPGVRWVGPYEPAYRLSPAIGTQPFRDPARRDAIDLTLIVRVFDDLHSAASRYQGSGARILERIENRWEKRLVLEIEPSALPDIASDPLTWYIEEKPEAFLLNNTTKWVVQSNANGQTPIWDQGISGEGQIVTIMDSGVDYNSCFFRENGNAPPSPTHRKILDYSTWGGNVYDGCDTGHGTHVAGTIAGDQFYINGSTNHAGMAFGAQLTVQDIGADGFLDCLLGFVAVPSSLTSAFNNSYGQGARIHSNSWGSSSNSYSTHSVNVDQFMWANPDFLIVFANGNAGPGGSTVGAPATAKNLISVGATQQAPNQNTIASYSSRGPAFDTRYKPTVCAPGGDSNGYITSANNHSGNPPNPTCSTQGSPFAGTSMATPAISGLAALTRDYFAQGFYPNGEAGGELYEPTSALVKAVIVNGATDPGSANIPNNNEGFGRALLDDALYFEGDTRELRVEEDAGVTTGTTVTFEYEIESPSEPFEVVLVWTDYPATQGAGVAIVNDLDLRVTAPGGQVYLGNVLSGGQSVTGGSADRRNVEEMFRLDTPPAGSYTIEIGGFNVPQGPQPFALASTGSFAGWPDDPASTPGTRSPLAGWELQAPEPNPSRSTSEIRFRAPAGSRNGVELAIYDLHGRLVRTLAKGQMRGGVHSLIWDGRDEGGHLSPEGVYFVRLRVGEERLHQKLTRLH